MRPKLIEGPQYRVYQELIARAWDENPAKRPSIQEIVETLIPF